MSSGSWNTRMTSRGASSLDALVATLLAALVCAVHDVRYLLSAPFWVDEAWVAASTRVPLHDLPLVSSTTPVLFSLLLRAAPGGDQGLRLVPLAFAGAAGGAAYLAGRAARLSRVASAALLGVPVLLAPAMLVRDDLKQYTAEGFWSVLVVLLLLRLEAEWSRSRLAVLAATCGLGVLLANADLFLGSAALLAAAAVCLARRRWARLRDVVVAGATAGLGMVLVLAAFVLPNRNQLLRHYWDAFYPTGGLSSGEAYVRTHLPKVADAVGLGRPALVVTIALLAAAVLCAVGRPAVGLLLPVAWTENAVAGRARLFPLLDVRTSTWLCVLVVVVAGLGVGLLLGRIRARGALITAPASVAVGLAYILHNGQDVGEHRIPAEDVRCQAHFVDDHRRPGDIVVLDVGANWGFGYYSSTEPLRPVRSSTVANGYVLAYGPSVVTMTGRARADASAAIRTARSRVAPGGQILVVRSHVIPTEGQGWRDVQTSTPGARPVRCGTESLLTVPAPR